MNENNVYTTYYQSPVGWLQICGTVNSIISVLYCAVEDESTEYLPMVVEDCVKQLDEYFKKERKTFDLSISQEGSQTMQDAWNEFQKIPYGETVSYKLFGKNGKNIKDLRAVGKASFRNKINIIVPCH